VGDFYPIEFSSRVKNILGFDLREIEKKWQKRWEEAKVFEANVEDKPKYFITFPYPYVNGRPHIGHAFTSLRTDTYARFKRLEGFNVLYPQGFHATGEPILGTIERLKQGDEVQIRTFKLFGATDEDLKDFVEKGPEYVARYWMEKFIEDFKAAGFSIDWRRSFITAITPQYNRFIEWQYKNLKEKGYVVQGTHPVIWCPKCQSPTGDHDRLKGEGESPIEFIIIKFFLETGEIIPCGTLRPETVFGVTNIWVNPKEKYKIAKVDGEKWILSEKAVEKLRDQLRSVEVIGEVDGSELVGKLVKNPVLGNKVPILPAMFVDPEFGTGIVMSVPAHAPYDWIGLEDLKKQGDERAMKIQPISIIEVEGYNEFPAKDACESHGVTSQEDREKLDAATEEVYKREFHKGVLKEHIPKYGGRKVSEIKEELMKELKEKGYADMMWECSGLVVCRCMTKCHVKILENQWFLKFSDENWKKKVKEAMAAMKFYPEEIRQQFLNTVDWLKNKACARKTGLGTKLPWDKEWIVETLSDSTIYMAYYTISHIIKENDITAEQLKDEVFDYVFLGKGNVEEVAKISGIEKSVLERMRREFEYFYPVDLRNSAKELVPNHLTFYVFHHVAIWEDPKYWPKAVAVNGFVTLEGEKMSKSKGNLIPLRNVIERFGADLVRINIVSAAEDLDDADWRDENVESFAKRIKFLVNLIEKLNEAKRSDIINVDRYLKSRLAKSLIEGKKAYEELKFRTATQHLFFDVVNDLNWYVERCGGIENCNQEVLRSVLKKIVRAISPLLPHITEEMWERLGEKPFVFQAGWPEPDEIDERSEMKEEFIRQIVEDIMEIEKIINKKGKRIEIYIADEWKFKVYEDVKNGLSVEEIRKKHALDEEKIKFVVNLMKRGKLIDVLSRGEQVEILNEAKSFLEKRLNAEVEIFTEEKVEKAKKATPIKPALLVLD